MPAYKLTYFNFKGLGEPVRFLLCYAGIDFVDERIDLEKDWPNVKSKTPFGQLPLLEVGGKKINQSIAICRYLAKQCGLAGRNDWEALEIDATVDTIQDLRVKVSLYLRDENEVTKAEKLRELLEESVPYFMQRFDEQVNRNGGYFVRGKLSYADLVFFGLLDCFNALLKIDMIEKAENLKALRARVLGEPKIKAWVAKRPVTEL